MPKIKASPFAIPLLDALRFVSVAQKKAGALDMERHCMMAGHMVVAFNGVIAAGSPISEDFFCCPQTDRLIAALALCKPGFTITRVADDRLEVRSGEFAAVIPLFDGAQLQWAIPDTKQVEVNDDVRAAILAVADIVVDKATVEIQEASILLTTQSAFATNGNIVMEAFHGWHLPPGLLLPKAAAKALKEAKRPVTGMGFGDTTVTFWYEDGSWIRTQRFLDKWPDPSVLSTQTNPAPIPRELFTVAEQLAPFSEDGQLYIKNGHARSHSFNAQDSFNGQTVAFSAMHDQSRVYMLASLRIAGRFATLYDDWSMPHRTFLYGAYPVRLGTTKSQQRMVKMRAIMTHSTDPDQVTVPTQQARTCPHGVDLSIPCAQCDAEIPF